MNLEEAHDRMARFFLIEGKSLKLSQVSMMTVEHKSDRRWSKWLVARKCWREVKTPKVVLFAHGWCSTGGKVKTWGSGTDRVSEWKWLTEEGYKVRWCDCILLENLFCWHSSSSMFPNVQSQMKNSLIFFHSLPNDTTLLVDIEEKL